MRQAQEHTRGQIRFWQALREVLYEEQMVGLVASDELTEGQIEEVRLRYAHGEFWSALAREFKVPSAVIKGHTKDVPRLCGHGSGVGQVIKVLEVEAA